MQEMRRQAALDQYEAAIAAIAEEQRGYEREMRRFRRRIRLLNVIIPPACCIVIILVLVWCGVLK